MRLINAFFYIFLTVIILNTAAFAKASQIIVKSNNTSVLPKGAKIVAGDLSKNEFFILADNEQLPQTKLSQQVKRDASSVKMITEKKDRLATTKSIEKINLVLNQLVQSELHRHGGKKSTIKIRATEKKSPIKMQKPLFAKRKPASIDHKILTLRVSLYQAHRKVE